MVDPDVSLPVLLLFLCVFVLGASSRSAAATGTIHALPVVLEALSDRCSLSTACHRSRSSRDECKEARGGLVRLRKEIAHHSGSCGHGYGSSVLFVGGAAGSQMDITYHARHATFTCRLLIGM